MKARVKSKFGRGFLLLEEHLLKIDDIITKRIESNDKVKVIYNVHRADDALITYDSAKDVISEENSNIDMINEIDIEAKDDHTNVEIVFSSDYNTSMSIECGQRDTALLLSSDLKSYLNSEICIQKFYWVTNLIKYRLFLPAIMTLIIFISVIVVSWQRAQSRPPKVQTQSMNTDQKLEYIIEHMG